MHLFDKAKILASFAETSITEEVCSLNGHYPIPYPIV